ncbi:MAG: hypothetical protein AMXMBFR82_02780 [Candidatus Hydrogenedentota bacterium]
MPGRSTGRRSNIAINRSRDVILSPPPSYSRIRIKPGETPVLLSINREQVAS